MAAKKMIAAKSSFYWHTQKTRYCGRNDPDYYRGNRDKQQIRQFIENGRPGLQCLRENFTRHLIFYSCDERQQ